MTSGLSKVRLDRMHEVMAAHVESGVIPGMVHLVACRGEVHVDTFGTLAVGGANGRRDSLFRITSMTKPITAVAAMILVEECVLRLDDPVDRLLPELADRKVLVSLDSPIDQTVPAQRPITLRDLLTFRLGYGQLLAPPDTYPIQRAETELGLHAQGPPLPATRLTPDEWITRFGTMPLVHQPGERWMYNTGAHVMSVLLARASGQTFPDLLRERVFEPLGMRDTGFFVPTQQRERFATQYCDAPGGGMVEADGPDGQWSTPPSFPDAAAGLVSTIDDYYAFANMLLHDGVHGSERILSRSSVELMRTDQLTAEQHATAGPILGDTGWGFGVSVVTRRDSLPAIGQYGWDGGFGTSWRNDPVEGLIGIQLTQRMWGEQGPPAAYYDFWTSAYQAIDN